MEHFDRASVLVQRPIGFSGASAIIGGVAGDIRVRPEFAADRGPTVVDRVKIGVVVGIKFVSNADLFLIVHALDLERLGLGARQSRQQQARKNGNNGNDHQQLDERERKKSASND
jgi:hypothetical protein